MRTSRAIEIVSCHAEGEVGDVIVGGVAPPPGETLWELYTTLDVLTVLLGLVTIGLCVGSLLAPRIAFVTASITTSGFCVVLALSR